VVLINKGERKKNPFDQSGTATFIIQIKYRENATWQGPVEWIEKKQKMTFRSALELIRIIDSTEQEGYQVRFDEDVPGERVELQ
jgi:Holliday junction resolvase-like predicted endonuclease